MTDERSPREDEDIEEFAEERASLVKITAAPVIWAGHFVVCYALYATSCAKGWPVGDIRAGLLWFSVAAMLGILWTGWQAWRQWDPEKTGDFADRGGRAEDRHHFLGHAALLLSVISFLGVAFVTLPLLLLEGCA